MENATKALLISAAVLIAIVLIALGVRLLNASGDSSNQAANVSNQLNNATGDAVNTVNNLLNGLPKASASN